MSRRELPPETAHQQLDFQQLIETLDVVEGEIVIVRIAPRRSDADADAGVISIVGQLRHVPPR